jgi:dynein light chain roadblock-type
LPQGTSTSTSTSPSSLPTPELEQTLALLSSHRSVLGYLLLSRGQPVSIIRHSGVVFEGEHGRKYAFAIGKIIDSVQSALEEVSGEVNEGVRILSRLLSHHFAAKGVISRMKFGSCVSEPSDTRS